MTWAVPAHSVPAAGDDSGLPLVRDKQMELLFDEF
ncbi:hypothetical protein QFZ94_008125 [Paraburkholderia sp. JPY465]